MTSSIVVVAALLLVPGLGAALGAAGPGAVSIETRIALVFGLGYALVAATATLLALAHLLSRPAFIAGLVLTTAVVWTVALRRASPRAHASALLSQAREAPFILAAGLALLLTVSVTRPLYPEGRNLAIAAPWRYWADGLEIAAAGQVPAQTAQWGTEIPTTVSKVVLNAFEGGLSLLVGPAPLQAMNALLVVTAVGLAASLLALGRELGFHIFAPLLPALVLLLPQRLPLPEELADDLGTYKVENIGRMTALCALLAGIYVVRGQAGRPLAAVSGALLAAAGLTHLVPALVSAAVLVLYAVATVVLDRSLRRRALTGCAVVAAAFGVCYGAILGLAGGNLGFERATRGAGFAELPGNIDPTRSFARGELVPASRESRSFFIPPRTIVRRYAQQTAGAGHTARFGALALAALAVATLIMVLIARPLVPVAVVAWGLVGTFLVAAILFSYRYSTQIPADFGLRRLYDYAVLPPALIIPGVLAAVTMPLARRGGAVVAALSLAVGALAVVAAVDRIPNRLSLPRAAAGLAVIELVADVVPCGARMLPNARTAGTWEATTGRRSVIEGMAPYLRPQIMARVLPVLVGAREFFRDPKANRRFLAQQRVEYVVVVEPGVWIGTAGGEIPAGSDVGAIASLPDVRPVFRGRRVTIFAVGSSAAARAGGQPRRCPL
jgi:hypothetical protein